MFKFCIEFYDEMIASGVSPSTRVPEAKNSEILWTAGLKKITDEVNSEHAPYRAHLKADNLRLVIDETHGGVMS